MISLLAFASTPRLEEAAGSLMWVLAPLGAIAVFLFLVFLFVFRLKRCAPNQLLVIYGKTADGSASTVLHGGQALVIPFIQSYAYLSLEPMEVEVEAEEDDTFLSGRIIVAVGAGEKTKHNAAIRLLGLTIPEIVQPAHEILLTEIRETIRALGGDVAVEDRNAFLEDFSHRVEPKLAQLGLVLINVHVDRFTTAEEEASATARGNGRG